MKVKDLIKELQKFDQELEVLVNGYEGGCDSPSKIDQIEIKRNYNSSLSYSGKHEEMEEWDKEDYSGCLKDFLDEGGIISKAIIIRR